MPEHWCICSRGMQMKFSFSRFLHDYKLKIIQEWVERLHTECGPMYMARPLDELRQTISEAVDANYEVLVNKNYDAINLFIDKITAMRLEAGFLLSDVQKAFELYRIIVVRYLVMDIGQNKVHDALERLNECLAYTTNRFSDHFQDMHQKKIIEQNKALEKMVKIRTAALEESEKKYKTLVEEIDDGYFVIQDGRIVFANQAFCSMHGYSLDEARGKNFSSFISDTDKEIVEKRIVQTSGYDTHPHTLEYNRLTRSGQELPTEIHGKTTSYDNKLSSIGICRDIKERVEMENKARENERMAYIGYITASLSHEIRNPLSAVKLNLQILNKNSKIKGNDKRRIDISVSEVIRLERILNQLLEFAKPLKLDLVYHDIDQILNSYIDLLEMKFKEKNLVIEKDFEKGPLKLLADSDKLGQAFINILINAIESSEPNSRISVSCRTCFENQKYVKVTIADEGKGLPEKNMEDLFKPFFTTKTKGVGLGLANVKRIVRAHKGFVSAENLDSKGALFSIKIPAGSM